MCLGSQTSYSKTTGTHPCDTRAGCPTLNNTHNWAVPPPKPAPQPPAVRRKCQRKGVCRRENTSGDESGHWRTGTATHSLSSKRRKNKPSVLLLGPSLATCGIYLFCFLILKDINFLVATRKTEALTSTAESGTDFSIWIFVIQAVGLYLRHTASSELFPKLETFFPLRLSITAEDFRKLPTRYKTKFLNKGETPQEGGPQSFSWAQ